MVKASDFDINDEIRRLQVRVLLGSILFFNTFAGLVVTPGSPQFFLLF